MSIISDDGWDPRLSSRIRLLVEDLRAEWRTRIADHPINRIDELLPWNLQVPSEMV